MNRARDWLRQAQDDLLWAEETLAAGRYSQACFVCQQCAEKALKALALHRGFDRVRGHSTLEIARSLGVDGAVESAARKLDLYYMSARYPDALPAGAPLDYFTREQAAEAVALAGTVVERVRTEMPADG